MSILIFSQQMTMMFNKRERTIALYGMVTAFAIILELMVFLTFYGGPTTAHISSNRGKQSYNTLAIDKLYVNRHFTNITSSELHEIEVNKHSESTNQQQNGDRGIKENNLK